MTKWTPFARRIAIVGAASVALASAAVGLPWDVDMADSQAIKGYETAQTAVGLPEGVVAQPHVLSPRGWAENYERSTDEGKALKSPFTVDASLLETGEKMYGVYCYPCHGYGDNLGPVAAPGRYPGVVTLTGETGIADDRSDGWIYLTIRNGGAIMPSYNWAMDDREMWSIVHYIRTQPGGAEKAVEPAAENNQ